MMPWFARSQFEGFRKECETFQAAFEKYLHFLEGQQSRTKQNHDALQPVRSLKDDWLMRTIEGTGDWNRQAYCSLQLFLEDKPLYEPHCLLDIQPSEAYRRRVWFDKLSLPYPVLLYIYRQGNYLGNISYIWKLPEQQAEHSDVDVVCKLREMLPIYTSRANRKEFSDKYSRIAHCKPGILRSIFSSLIGNDDSAETKEQSEVDLRVAKFLLETEETELIWDLRALNGSKANPVYEPF